MSYKQNNSMKKEQQQGKQHGKPFCKVCFDAGKSEREYTSHFVKSKPGNDGKVVCPYLLSLECSYCKKKEGHTVSHCPLLAQKKASQSAAAKPRTVVDQEGWSSVNKKQAQQTQAQQTQAQQTQAQQTQAAQQTQKAQQKQETQQKQVQKPQAMKSTLAVLADLIQREEKKEVEVETRRIQYDAEFPGILIKTPVTRKQPLAWSSIDMKAPMKVRPQPPKPLVHVKMPILDEREEEYEDNEPQAEIEEERAWEFGDSWADCPN